MKKTMSACFTTILFATTACAGSGIEGEWENKDNDAGYDDVLILDAEGSGSRVEELEGYVTISIDGYEYDVLARVVIEQDVSWEDVGDDNFDAEIECDAAKVYLEGELALSGCSDVAQQFFGVPDLDIGDAECELVKEGTELECDTDGGEATYEKQGE